MAQGGTDKPDILYQDNESSILMETNGRISYRKGLKHIDIWFSYVTNCVTRGDIEIVYMPKEEMIANFFTKPLQGKLFLYFHNKLLGIREEDYNL